MPPYIPKEFNNSFFTKKFKVLLERLHGNPPLKQNWYIRHEFVARRQISRARTQEHAEAAQSCVMNDPLISLLIYHSTVPTWTRGILVIT